MLIVLAMSFSATVMSEEREDSSAIGVAVIRRAKSLRQASNHLRDAGKDKLADEIAQESADLIRPALRILEDKRQEAARLNQEIAELEQQLDHPSEMAIRVRLFTIPKEVWEKLKPNSVNQQPGQLVPVDQDWLDQLETWDRQRSSTAVLFSTTLTTRHQSAAKTANGGKIPVPVPDVNGTVAFQWRELGDVFEAIPLSLGFGDVELLMSVSHTEKADQGAVILNGAAIPGLDKRKIHARGRSELGKALLLRAFEVNDFELIYLVTPERGGAMKNR
jgi:hypothetical protein